MVDNSPWPIGAAMGAWGATLGGVLYLTERDGFGTVIRLAGLVLLYSLFGWCRDVLRESRLGHHTTVVQMGPRYGSVLFICSEVMFLLAVLWAFYHSALAPSVELGCVWPPAGLLLFDPRNLPLLNTLIPPTSGGAITWAHHALLSGRTNIASCALVATVTMALLFTLFQGLEYGHSYFSFSDSIYGSTFYFGTGAHGVHVMLGSLYSILCCFRQSRGQLAIGHHVGFETAAWYWHFVDVVRIILYVSIYWWGA